MNNFFLKYAKLSQEKLILVSFLVGLLIQQFINTSLDYTFLNNAITLCIGFIIFRALHMTSFQKNTLKQVFYFGPLVYVLESVLISSIAYLFWELPLLLALLLAFLSAALSPALVYPKLIQKKHALNDSQTPLKLAALFDNSLTVLITTILLSFTMSTHLSIYSFLVETIASLAFGIISTYVFIFLLSLQKNIKTYNGIFFLWTIFILFLALSNYKNFSFFFMVIAFSLMLSNYVKKPAYQTLKSQLDILWQRWPYLLAVTFILIGIKIQLKNLLLVELNWLIFLFFCIGFRYFLLYLLAKKILNKKTKEALEIASIMIPKLTLQLAFIPILIHNKIPFARLLAGSLLASILISLCFHFAPTFVLQLTHVRKNLQKPTC